MGTLDADGKQTVSVPVPPGLLLSLVGTNSFWAYPLFNPSDYASNPVVLDIAN